jgi:16S rRNA (guanine527-N7)-methyltransferase
VDAAFREALASGARALRLELPEGTAGLLERYADRLLAWNRKVNLTAVTAPAEVAEKHLLDSLLVLKVLGPARSLLDVGSGAGLPGIVVACARPDVVVTCCDSIAKKVAFVKAVSAELGLANARGVVARAAGAPERDGLPLADLVVSRAVSEPELWLPLGSAYLAPGGTLVAMLGREADEQRLAAVGRASGLALAGVERFELPLSRSARALASWRRVEGMSRSS